MSNQSIKERYQHRKDEHLSLAIKYWQKKKNFQESGFHSVSLVPNALPEMSIDDVDLSTELFGYSFEFPYYIEAMTGGSEKGDKINEKLVEIAKNQHLAMAVGSQSIALKYPELAWGFKKVRTINPNGFLFANIGAGHSLDDAKRAVDMIAANALELHINVAQELTMRDDEGDRDFYWFDNINDIATRLGVPVIVKEVGFGMSQQTFRMLEETGVSAINIGGTGGTDFIWIERQRQQDKGGVELFDYGFSTVESLKEAQLARTNKSLIATGGIRSASDIIKALGLGAQLTSSAGHMLLELMTYGVEGVEEAISERKKQLANLYILTGVRNIKDIHSKRIVKL